MNIKRNMEVKPEYQTYARIKVLGVGGAGGNAVNRMKSVGIDGVEFISINTDAQALNSNQADVKIYIGKTQTVGLGSGMNPEVGQKAAEESRQEVEDAIKNADMVFITCGLGGGTGTGASPIIAEIAKNLGILTIAVVTKPFSFEGSKRKELAEIGYENLKEKVDAIITIHNDRILQIDTEKRLSVIEGFKQVDEVLRQGIAGISDLITNAGVVNSDFADVKTIMQNAGTALMGIGAASGENRAEIAAKQAINSPLLDMAIDGAKGILFNIYGHNIALQELTVASNIIFKHADIDGLNKFGYVEDESLGDELRITVIATGFDENAKKAYVPSQNATSGILNQTFGRMNNTQTQDFSSDAVKSETNKLSSESAAQVTPAPTTTNVVSSTKPESYFAASPSTNLTDGFKSASSKPIDAGIMPKTIPSIELEIDELDIPAFIRKKMN